MFHAGHLETFSPVELWYKEMALHTVVLWLYNLFYIMMVLNIHAILILYGIINGIKKVKKKNIYIYNYSIYWHFEFAFIVIF